MYVLYRQIFSFPLSLTLIYSSPSPLPPPVRSSRSSKARERERDDPMLFYWFMGFFSRGRVVHQTADCRALLLSLSFSLPSLSLSLSLSRNENKILTHEQLPRSSGAGAAAALHLASERAFLRRKKERGAHSGAANATSSHKNN